MSHRLGGAVLSLCAALLAGCSSIELVQNPQQAKPVDFGKLYTGTLAAKYGLPDEDGKTGLVERLRQYDGAESERAALEESRRASEAKQREALKDQARDLQTAIQNASNKSVVAKGEKQATKVKIDHLVQLQARLAKQPATEETNNRIAGIKLELENLGTTSELIDANQILIDGELTALRADLARIKNAITALDKEVDPVELRKKMIRDEVVKDFLAMADSNYLEFKDVLLTGRATTDTVGDIAELLLSTAATLTGGVTSKTNLAAASTLLKGSRATIDKNFFAQQTMRAIINSIEAGRASDKQLILAKLNKPTSDYPLSEAVSDAQRYESRASLASAILDIANQTGENAANETRLLNLQSVPGLHGAPSAVPSP